jgi:hypothetical protein
MHHFSYIKILRENIKRRILLGIAWKNESISEEGLTKILLFPRAKCITFPA